MKSDGNFLFEGCVVIFAARDPRWLDHNLDCLPLLLAQSEGILGNALFRLIWGFIFMISNLAL